MDLLRLLLARHDPATYTYAVLAYLLPVTLYCSCTALAFLQLAWQRLEPRRAVGWSGLVLALPLVGAALVLLWGPGRAAQRAAPLALLGGGASLVAAGFCLIAFVFR